MVGVSPAILFVNAGRGEGAVATAADASATVRQAMASANGVWTRHVNAEFDGNASGVFLVHDSEARPAAGPRASLSASSITTT